MNSRSPWPAETRYILGAAVVLVALVGLGSHRSHHFRKSQILVMQVADRLDIPLEHQSSPPSPLTSLVENDGWGRPIQVEYRAESAGEHLIVTSAGRDGRFGTPDDIVEKRWLPKLKGDGEGSAEQKLAHAGEVASPKGPGHSLKHSLKKSAEAALEGREAER